MATLLLCRLDRGSHRRFCITGSRLGCSASFFRLAVLGLPITRLLLRNLEVTPWHKANSHLLKLLDMCIYSNPSKSGMNEGQ